MNKCCSSLLIFLCLTFCCYIVLQLWLAAMNESNEYEGWLLAKLEEPVKPVIPNNVNVPYRFPEGIVHIMLH